MMSETGPTRCLFFLVPKRKNDLTVYKMSKCENLTAKIEYGTFVNGRVWRTRIHVGMRLTHSTLLSCHASQGWIVNMNHRRKLRVTSFLIFTNRMYFVSLSKSNTRFWSHESQYTSITLSIIVNPLVIYKQSFIFKFILKIKPNISDNI
jgi:hypothetical protein